VDRFSQCLAFVLRPDIEGGYVNDPLDKGGTTNKGITQRTYTAWLRGRKEPDAEVRNIRDDQVQSIYHEQYWLPMQGDRMQQPVDMVLFDAAVQHGVSRAIRILQEALQVPIDGALGAVTLNAAVLDSAAALAMDILAVRAQFYTRIIDNNRQQAAFANGWANRLEKLKAEAGL
jgi:lysozyme family protein